LLKRRPTVLARTVLARVGEDVITLQDLTGPFLARSYALQREEYNLERQALESAIDTLILKKAAMRREWG